jgi:hypothetical protein
VFSFFSILEPHLPERIPFSDYSQRFFSLNSGGRLYVSRNRLSALPKAHQAQRYSAGGEMMVSIPTAWTAGKTETELGNSTGKAIFG